MNVFWTDIDRFQKLTTVDRSVDIENHLPSQLHFQLTLKEISLTQANVQIILT